MSTEQLTLSEVGTTSTTSEGGWDGMSVREALKIMAHDRHRERFWERHDRESYTCPMCEYEARSVPGEFEVHHIDGDWLNGHPINLVAICHRCHVRVHKIRNREQALEEWKSQITALSE